MARFSLPLYLRFKYTDGSWSARAMADMVPQALGFLTQWREQGRTEFDIEDATGQPVKEADLHA